jgi:hypothetical protein
MSDENKEVKDDTVQVSEVSVAEPSAFATKGLLPQELEMAEKHGLVIEEADKVDESSKEEKDGEHKVDTEPKTEEDTGEKEKEEVTPTFEDVEKNEDKLKKYNPNEQALYWKYKADKKKRQKAQKESEEWRAKYELNSVKDSSHAQKVKKISEALKGETTVEALLAIIGEESEDTTPVTKADLKRLESAKTEKQKVTEDEANFRKERLETAESIGKSKYDNFEELTTMANEVVSSDKTGTYRSVLDAAFSDINLDEGELIERVVTIAKLSPNYGKKKSEETTEEKTDVDRAIKNSKKKVSSASVGSGGGKRNVSHEDLTVDDAAKLTTTQWMKLPDKVRERLLMQ